MDVGRIALIGESAGGHLVSWVGTRAKEDTRVAAVVPVYAPHDLELQVKHLLMASVVRTACVTITLPSACSSRCDTTSTAKIGPNGLFTLTPAMGGRTQPAIMG